MRTKSFSLDSLCHVKKRHQISQSELKDVLNNIKNHPTKTPKPKSITIQIPNDYANDFEVLAIRACRHEERRIYREECNTAFKLKVQNSMKGGIFSLAQQLANKSGKNILAIDDSEDLNYPKRKLFKPQPHLLMLVSSLGYALFG